MFIRVSFNKSKLFFLKKNQKLSLFSSNNFSTQFNKIPIITKSSTSPIKKIINLSKSGK